MPLVSVSNSIMWLIWNQIFYNLEILSFFWAPISHSTCFHNAWSLYISNKICFPQFIKYLLFPKCNKYFPVKLSLTFLHFLVCDPFFFSSECSYLLWHYSLLHYFHPLATQVNIKLQFIWLCVFSQISVSAQGLLLLFNLLILHQEYFPLSISFFSHPTFPHISIIPTLTLLSFLYFFLFMYLAILHCESPWARP